MDYLLRIITSRSNNQYYILAIFFIRSCLDETQLCNGSALCPNKADLKYCQNAISLGLTYADWKPIYTSTSDFVSCNHLGQHEQKNLQGQQINSLNVNDNRFHCWNRKDEQPFISAKTTNRTNDGNQKTWLDNVENPCEQGITETIQYSERNQRNSNF